MKNRILCLLFFIGIKTVAQETAGNTNYPQPVNFTAEQDHDNMMKQLGIKALRPGPSGDEKMPNHANYDEKLTNLYPNIPGALTLKNGKKVTAPAMWRNQRRPEIVED